MTKGFKICSFCLPEIYMLLNSSSNFNTEGNKWPRITLLKRDCLCEAKLQVQLNNTTTIEYESVSFVDTE